MRGAGAHSVAKCRGLGGYYRVAVSHVGRDGVRGSSASTTARRSGTLSGRTRLASRNCALPLMVPARVSHWSNTQRREG